MTRIGHEEKNNFNINKPLSLYVTVEVCCFEIMERKSGSKTDNSRPDLSARFAKMDAARRAKKKNDPRVTVKTARETERGYEQALDKEAVELKRRMAWGGEKRMQTIFYCRAKPFSI